MESSRGGWRGHHPSLASPLRNRGDAGRDGWPPDDREGGCSCRLAHEDAAGRRGEHSMTVETKVGSEGPPTLPPVSPIKVWAPSWWASFLDVEGSNFVENPWCGCPPTSRSQAFWLISPVGPGWVSRIRSWSTNTHGCLSASSDRWPLSWRTTTPSPSRASLSVRSRSIRPSLLTGTQKGRL